MLNAWAHMIQMGKHSSYEDPPNYPYFGRKHPKKAAASDDGESSSQGSVLGSPGKRIHLRSECIEQLSHWHSLMEKGGITAAEYEDLSKNILGDIAKFCGTSST